MQSHGYENDFLFSCKSNSFSEETICAWPRFDSDSFWNSEMAYKYVVIANVIFPQSSVFDNTHTL